GTLGIPVSAMKRLTMRRAAYSPRNAGLRFSIIAATPLTASAVHGSIARKSRSQASRRGEGRDRAGAGESHPAWRSRRARYMMRETGGTAAVDVGGVRPRRMSHARLRHWSTADPRLRLDGEVRRDRALYHREARWPVSRAGREDGDARRRHRAAVVDRRHR